MRRGQPALPDPLEQIRLLPGLLVPQDRLEQALQVLRVQRVRLVLLGLRDQREQQAQVLRFTTLPLPHRP